MAPVSKLDATELSQALETIARVLSEHAVALNQLDSSGLTSGDFSDYDGSVDEVGLDVTGVGDELTAAFRLAVDEIQGATTVGAVASAAANGASRVVFGYAGNSIQKVLQALAEVLNNADAFDGQRLALGLELAAERLAPGEDGAIAGTMPTVVAAAATGALEAFDQGLTLADVVISAADEGLQELETGPVSNPVLSERGVVDATSAGFLLILDTLGALVAGDPLPSPPVQVDDENSGGRSASRFVLRCEVEPLEGCGVESASWLEDSWNEIGSLERFEVSAARWAVELHTTLPGVAIEALCEVGKPRELQITLVDQ